LRVQSAFSRRTRRFLLQKQSNELDERIRPVCFDSSAKHTTTIPIDTTETTLAPTLDRIDSYPNGDIVSSRTRKWGEMLPVAMLAVLAVLVFLSISKFLVSAIHKHVKRQPSTSKESSDQSSNAVPISRCDSPIDNPANEFKENTIDKQKPFAAVLSGADPRVPAEPRSGRQESSLDGT
jgi:hypothetical protein